jgi:CubicO group peptidase (beta-lactamase class C family)
MRAIHLLLLLFIGFAAGPSFGDMPDDQYAEQARATLDKYFPPEQLNGTVLVAHDGKPIFREAFGLANREWNVANTPDTKFRIGSVSKQFTATAILQLAEQGKLSIDDPVSKYYAAAPAAWQKITIKHLLTHSSGIPSFTSSPNFFKAGAMVDRTPEEVIALTRDQPLEFEPGSQFAYDNSGYVLLGYIIEKVSGETYAGYLQKHIFEPLGMHDTGYEMNDAIIPRMACGYRLKDKVWSKAAYLSMDNVYAAGAIDSTVDDLLRWEQALYAAKPIGDASLKQMTTDYGHKYGFGIFIGQSFGRDMLWHSGGINGFRSVVGRFPKDALTVIVLSNLESAPVEKIGETLAGLYFGAGQKTAAASADDLAPYIGDYKLSSAMVVKVAREGDHLTAQVTHQPSAELYAKGNGIFAYKLTDAQIAFHADKDGRIAGLTLHQGALDMDATGIDAAEAQTLADTLARRVKDQTAVPGSENALRNSVDEIARGQPNYDKLSPVLANATRQQLPRLQRMLQGLGALQSISFKGVGPGGSDIYELKFANATIEGRILLSPDGIIESMLFH